MRSRTTAGLARPPRQLPSKAVLLAGALLAPGCALLGGGAPPAPFALLPPASYGGTVRAEQILTLSRAGSSTTLQAFVDLTPAKISVVGATALGQRALALGYDGATLKDEGPGGDAARNEQVLRDLELMTWPLAALEQALAGTPWRVTEPRAGTRQLWRGETLAVEIHYSGASPWEGRSWLVNLDARYTLALDSKVVR